MKLSIISDTHLGDPLCTLVTKNGKSLAEGPKYKDFREAAGTNNDYLILLGDILDFSVTSYENAYKAGKVFFSLIQKDKIAEQIIYVPGNHDYDIWNIVENEVNIIHQIKHGRLPRKFKMAVPGILDDRTGSKTRGLILPGINKNKYGRYNYGGLFLDSITREWDNKTKTSFGEPINFLFAYPNLYLVTDKESILMTHGHYFDSYWSLLSKYAPAIFNSDLKIGSKMDIAELVGINFPLNQLACSGVGQAGILSDLISELQSQIKRGEIKKAKEYLDNLDDYLDENVFVNKKWYQFANEAVSDLISNKVKEIITDTISNQKETRYNEQFLDNPEVKERFIDYYRACLVEIEDLERFYNISIPKPNTLIFGHTHEPISYGKRACRNLIYQIHDINLFNTGGWLLKENGKSKVFCGAEVFKYDSGKSINSESISAACRNPVRG
jgi:predicted phosphodiesterase